MIEEERLRKFLTAVPAKAVKFLYERYHDSLLHLSLHYTRDIEASRDIVQETFLHIWENARKLGQRHDQPIQRYLVRVVKLKSITSFHTASRLKVEKAKYFRSNGSGVDHASAEVDLIRRELMLEIKSVVESFPVREKECLLLRFEQELSTQEIADRLQVSVKAVERSITSGKKRLRRHWNDQNKKF